MQVWMQTLRDAWVEPAGWALIVTGLALAARTLGGHGRRRLGPAAEGPPRTLDTPHSGASECESQWQRLAQIIQSEIARAESLPELQARAIDAVEAADEAVTSLLAECRLTNGSTDTAAVRQQQDAVPTHVVRPLAA